MNRLFIDLYLDEDVDVLIADLLHAYGFDALTTRDAGNLRGSDSKQLAFAIGQKRTLLTHNRADFEELAQEYFEAGREHRGIICAVRRPPREITRRLLTIIEHVTAEEMENKIRYI